MKIEPSTVKGFQDFLPPESLKRKIIVETASKNFELFGFQPIETPIIEYNELMKSDNLNEEDEAVSDRFKLTDKGNRSLGLRYEFTFQLARIFKEKPNIKLPFKRYQIGPIFRDEPIRKGRTRQFTQCDVDIIGDSTINADAECIAAVSTTLKKLNIKSIISINNRKLLNSIIESVQINSSQQVLRELDKIEKLGIDTIKSNLKKFTSSNQILTLFKLLEKDLSFFIENDFDGANELEDLILLLKTYGIKTKFTPSLIRGFSYYTGNIFEALIENSKTAIAGGGRYDNIIGKFLPQKIPAVGFSFSIEAISSLCESDISKIKISPLIKTLIISFNQYNKAILLSKILRKNNISCTLTEGQPSKSLDYANSLQIPYVIFLGEEEIKLNKYKLKNMNSGNEYIITEKQLINKLKK